MTSGEAFSPVPNRPEQTMDINTLRIVATVASFAAFIGIWGWAWSRARRGSFDDAARIPFQQD
jgi:cytochrome c oxidase cbb3-type subunit 4